MRMMQQITEPEFTQLAARVATAMKAEKLRRMPGMDAVAVALNCGANSDETAAVKHALRLVQQAGYVIAKDVP